ncbi:DUF1800 domain-containing protein [Nibrella saemangeumensis]|uniref:DUF1800 domain-containing protein n=1 Tax=Nibrella saemangeumensis TaxID=1084526 RepID=A0ABP8MYI6_9BACT
MERTPTHKLRHLFGRAGFDATPVQLNDAARQPLRKVVRSLFTDSNSFEPLSLAGTEEAPDRRELRGMFRNGQIDRDKLREQIRMSTSQIRDMNLLWLDRMASGRGALREKMALFWHGHFACRVRNPQLVRNYLNTLRQHALGKFSDLLMAVSKEPAMLQFLNNQQNRKNAPNENFAREVMELFTLGRGNYTEKDIKEAARAFTGWGFTLDGKFVFRPLIHDADAKTIFGQTGTFKGEDVIAMLLEKKQTARFITGKIYRYFVNETEDPRRVDELSEQFYRSGYDIAALMETIFSADWFYDKANIGTHIKSPVELLAGMQHTLGLTFEQRQPPIVIQRTLRQVLLYPPNVAGWPGGKSWIDSSSLLFRMRLPDYLLKSSEVTIRPKDDGDVNNELLTQRGERQFRTKVNWPAFESHFSGIPEAKLPDALATCLLPWPLSQPQRELIAKQVKSGQSRSEQIQTLTAALMSLPEYQLS